MWPGLGHIISVDELGNEAFPVDQEWWGMCSHQMPTSRKVEVL